MKKYLLYDNYEMEFGELLYEGTDFQQLMRIARKRYKDTDGECKLQYLDLAEESHNQSV